jgi:RHS repeat-associated protein
MALVNASTGAESARYEYGPFGEDIRATGPMAQINPMRFSTQYADDVTGDRKYLFRDYRIFLGRWLNRDPLEEQGGVNLYGFLANRGVSLTDTFGLGPFSLYVRKIEDSLAAGEEENAAFEAWKLYIAIGRNQEVLIPVPVAARFINRWLDKVGGTAPLSPSEVEELMNERTVRTMIANEVIARGYAGSGSVTSLRFRDLTATSKTDYFYALGWFQASFSGTYSVSASNGSVVLDGCFRMWDRYDWQNPGNKSVVLPPPPYPNGDVIYDRYATLVEDHGYATPFRVTGAANLRVEAEPGPLPRPR